MQSLKNEFARLKLQVADNEGLKLKVESLTTEVEDLKAKAANAEAEVHFLRQSLSPQPATPLAPALPSFANTR